MIDLARSADPEGSYELIAEGDFSMLPAGAFDLVLSAFAFDNIPGAERRAELLRGLVTLLNERGRIVILGSTPEIYTHEWASFTTRDFPENKAAKSGEPVRIVMTDVPDRRPVVDLIWFHEDYLKLFASAGADLVARYTPLGCDDEPCAWVSETSIAPWVIYVLRSGRRV